VWWIELHCGISIGRLQRFSFFPKGQLTVHNMW
jgi:hypothetical protein